MIQFKELLKKIDLIDAKLRKHYGDYPDEEKRVLARTVKLNEEIGELCEQILLHNDMQRGDKLDKKSFKDLEDEFSDVIITTLLLAKTANVNIEKSLMAKLKKIKTRGGV